ncbi:MAG: cyclodeaminase/cyclohydrolase family protein [Ignavibacteriae bacterium]|nr:cyclodeaminase/cyclohydrolase family protein [Ignavibacteriota bacterium]
MLIEKTVSGFLDEVASNSAAPGGGSIAALAGALGAGLTSMVCRLTVGKKKYADVEAEMQQLLRQAEDIRAEFTRLIEKDTEAFNSVMRAFSLPKDDDDQKNFRSGAIQEATKSAALVPLQVMELCERTLPLALEVATKGNVNSVSDAGVAAEMLRAACISAALNVRINLGTIQDDSFVHDTSLKAKSILTSVDQKSVEILHHVNAVIGSNIRS